MTHEILIAESRKELEWLDRKDQYHQMLYNFATQKYPVCLLLIDSVNRKLWSDASHHLNFIFEQLVATRIINLASKHLNVYLPKFQTTILCNDEKSIIGKVFSARCALENCHYGKYASIDISQIKQKTFFGRFTKQKESVFIQEKIAFPTFPEKFKFGTSAVGKLDLYTADFVAKVGYYLYVRSKTSAFNTEYSAENGHTKAANKNERNIPVGLSGKSNQPFTEIRLAHNTKFSFHRTLRVPETGQKHQLPADLGALPIHRIEDYADKVPAHWLEDGGLFIPLYQKEAMFIQFEGNTSYPSIAKVCVGRINAVTGGPFNENLNEHKQDYVLIPHQKWLDGINMGNGIVRQFVAMPLGQGYTVEAQLTDEETFGGFQLILYPPKEGRFSERDLGIDSRIKIPEPTKISKKEEKIEENSTAQKTPLDTVSAKPKLEPGATQIDDAKTATPPPIPAHEKMTLGSSPAVLMSPAAGPGMGIAAGGNIQQQIYPDIFGALTWNADSRRVISIRLVNSITYKTITGFDPPPSPITPDLYQKSGYQWFSYFDENLGSVQGSKLLSRVQTVEEIERRRGIATPNTAPQPMRANPPRIIRTPEVSELLNELRNQAKMHLDSMNWKESLRTITMVLSIENSSRANDYVMRSNCNAQLGYAKEGFIDACLALEIDPNCFDALASRASCRLLLGDYEGAEEDARVLTSVPTTEPIGLAIQAELLVLNNRFQDAVYAALRALKKYPENKKLNNILEKARVESVKHAKNNAQ